MKERLRKVVLDFQDHKDYEKAYSQIMTDDVCIRRQLKNDDRFRQHVRYRSGLLFLKIYRYLLLFDDRSGVQIRQCLRYASESHVGAAIFATKDW